MSSDLKKLVRELEILLADRGDLLDAPARNEFTAQIERLKKAIDEADAEAVRGLRYEALKLTAAVLSVITNVMTLLK